MVLLHGHRQVLSKGEGEGGGGDLKFIHDTHTLIKIPFLQVVSLDLNTLSESLSVKSISTHFQWCRKESGLWGLEPPPPPHNLGAHSNEAISHMNTSKLQKNIPLQPPPLRHSETSSYIATLFMGRC